MKEDFVDSEVKPMGKKKSFDKIWTKCSCKNIKGNIKCKGSIHKIKKHNIEMITELP